MNRVLILLWGIRRAGNHVIHPWLLRQFQHPMYEMLNVEYDAVVSPGAEKRQFIKDCSTLLVGFESHPLTTVRTFEHNNYFEKSLGHYDKIKNIIILRDPWNLFASQLSCGERRLGHPVGYLWAEYAKSFIEKPYDAEYVSYNEFVTDETYRRALSEKIGGTFNDSTIDDVSKHGRGSSFDETTYNGRGREMDVFGRWKVWRDVDTYKRLFTQEVEELADKLFGKWKPGEAK